MSFPIIIALISVILEGRAKRFAPEIYISFSRRE